MNPAAPIFNAGFEAALTVLNGKLNVPRSLRRSFGVPARELPRKMVECRSKVVNNIPDHDPDSLLNRG
jgi:hypothetical protein